MALSDGEQRRLAQIEAHVRATDPDFVLRLDLAGAWRGRRQLRRMCWWLLALGASMMLMGLSSVAGVISFGSLLTLCGSALTMWSALTARGLRVRRPRARKAGR